MSHWQRARARLAADRRFRVSAFFLALLACIAVFAELLAADAPIVAAGRGRVSILAAVTERPTYAALTRAQIDEKHAEDLAIWPLFRQSPDRISTPLDAPSLRHPLGTDGRGYDVLARLIHGTRAVLAPAAFAIVLSLMVGGWMGSLAGTLGGVWDELVARPIEVLQSFPTVLVIAMAMTLDPKRSGWTLALSVAAVRWADIARVVRVDALRLATNDSVTAARALGASPFRIVRRHVLPRSAPSMIASALAALPALVVLESSMEFLGVGQRGAWGTLLADGMTSGGSPWASACAAAALFTTVATTVVLADSFAAAVTPRAEGEPAS